VSRSKQSFKAARFKIGHTPQKLPAFQRQPPASSHIFCSRALLYYHARVKNASFFLGIFKEFLQVFYTKYTTKKRAFSVLNMPKTGLFYAFGEQILYLVGMFTPKSPI
jgi:hypothetical protein